MFDGFYDLLDKIGYLHPIHPAMTHMPIGLVVGSLFLGTAGWLSDRPPLVRAAYYTLVLAFLFWFPTIVFGLMDWQRYYAGAWLHPIKFKLILASLLFVLLLIGVLVGYRDPTKIKRLLPIYLLFYERDGAGLFRWSIGLWRKDPEGLGGISRWRTAVRQQLFRLPCTWWQRYPAQLPTAQRAGTRQIGGFPQIHPQPETVRWRRGTMPAFPPAKISDPQVSDLYDYIVHAIDNPSRN